MGRPGDSQPPQVFGNLPSSRNFRPVGISQADGGEGQAEARGGVIGRLQLVDHLIELKHSAGVKADDLDGDQ